MANSGKTNESSTHGGVNDMETVTQTAIAHTSSTIRKTVNQSRPPVTQAETLIRILFPKQ